MTLPTLNCSASVINEVVGATAAMGRPHGSHGAQKKIKKNAQLERDEWSVLEVDPAQIVEGAERKKQKLITQLETCGFNLIN